MDISGGAAVVVDEELLLPLVLGPGRARGSTPADVAFALVTLGMVLNAVPVQGERIDRGGAASTFTFSLALSKWF